MRKTNQLGKTEAVNYCYYSENCNVFIIGQTQYKQKLSFINLWIHVNYRCPGLQCDLQSRSVGGYQIRHVHEDIYKYP